MRHLRFVPCLSVLAAGILAAGCADVDSTEAVADESAAAQAAGAGARLDSAAGAALVGRGVPQSLVSAAIVQPVVNVILTLARQPIAEIEAVQKLHLPRLDELRDQARVIQRTAFARPSTSLAEDEERRIVDTRAPMATAERTKLGVVLREMDARRQTMRREAFARMTAAASQEQTAVAALVRSTGGAVYASSPVTNVLAARIPSAALPTIAKDVRIASLGLDTPAEEELDVSAPTVKASAFWNAGYDGGIWDIGICDNGVDKSHAALSSHSFYGDSTTTGTGHGTHVAGIVGSTNATHKGIAFGLDAIVSKKCSSESSVMTGFDWMLSSAGDDADVGNISQGYGTVATDDTSLSRYFDALVDGLDFMVAKSAGNNGNGGASATITYPGNSYNILSVANMDDKGTTSRSDDRIRSTSSQGPTPNGRKKPDITAPGTNIKSTVPGGGFDVKSGTSMAAPHVAGALLLLMDAGVYKPATAKAVLLNTADAWSSTGAVTGSSWNKVYGWGYLDLWEAHFNMDDYFERTIGASTSANAKHIYEGKMYTGEKATLVWNRRAVANGASSPSTYYGHNKVYLYLKDKATGVTVASSTSTIDNVQQVACPAAYTGKVMRVEVVSAQAVINGGGSQEYSLATEENFVKIQ